MNPKRLRALLFIPLCFIFAALGFAWVTLRYDVQAAMIEFIAAGALCLICFLWLYIVRRDAVRIILHAMSRLDFSKKRSVEMFPLPMAVTDVNGGIVFFNERFISEVSQNNGIENGNILQFLKDAPLGAVLSNQGTNIFTGDRHYSVFSSETRLGDKPLYVFYFYDNTALKAISLEYEQSRPSVALITIDGVEEIQKNYSASQFGEIRLGVERILGEWAADRNCIYHKMSGDRYIMVLEERDLAVIKSSRFQILEDVRAFAYQEKPVGVTLSVGVGQGAGFSESESNARQALDMAQSRGGDQAAVKNKDSSYSFFGGISKGVEKKTKVKTRIMASAIAELMKASSGVFVVGHRFPDLDSAGAALGLCAAAQSMNKPAFMVMDKSKSLAMPLVRRLEEEGKGELVISPHEALSRMGKNFLLIVTDTHVVDFVEEPELLKRASSVIVVDHHRKSVNFINNAVIFFHDPGASSASEMVAELLQYMGNNQIIGKLEADALLAGIMLDTRSFILRTGVRTFEAAAYLKSRGADPVRVKKMFASSLESHNRRSGIIASAVMYKRCAISAADFESPDIRVICAQAADELLGISDIDASFVAFENGGKSPGGTINISARSLGAMNVQVVMEKIGGGGHQTMAAAQIAGVGLEDAVGRLRDAIDEYNS
ncbi:MAG: DHH family phosphoesterase [Oscillospiraceae bacterium]|nr:DHH family phosphoesterase [Oscillospiraceae bacterium]